MPLTGSLFDNFNTNTVNAAVWATEINAGGTIQNTNGQLRYYSALTGMDSSLFSIGDPYSLLDSYIQCEVVSAGNQALASLLVRPCRFGVPSGERLFFAIQANTLSAIFQNGPDIVLASTTYNSTAHKWFRLQGRGANVQWLTAASSTGPWATLYSTVAPIPIGTSSFLELAAEAGAEASTTLVIFDNFNIVSNAASTTKPTIRFFVNTTSASKANRDIATTTTALIRFVANTTTVSKVNTKTATLTKALIRFQVNNTTASAGAVIDNKTATTTKHLISIIVNPSTASKGSSKTAQLTQAVLRVVTGALSASKSQAKTAQLTKAIVSIVTNAITASKTQGKTASLTKVLITIKTNNLSAFAGQEGVGTLISVRIVAQSQLQNIVLNPSRINKYLNESSQMETRVSAESEICQKSI